MTKTTTPITIRVGEADMPLTASLEALEALSAEFGIAQVRDLMPVLMNPTSRELISILSAFARAAGTINPHMIIAKSSIDIGEALRAVVKVISPLPDARNPVL